MPVLLILLSLLALVYPVSQVRATVRLVRGLYWAKREFDLPDETGLSFALGVLPTIMLVIAILVFRSPLGKLDQGWAGATILPVWLIAVRGLLRGLGNADLLYESKPTALLIATLAFFCGWYAFQTAMMDFTGTGSNRLELLGRAFHDALRGSGCSAYRLLAEMYLVSVPALPCINLVLLLVHIHRTRRLKGSLWPFAAVWAGALVATLGVKLLVAGYAPPASRELWWF